MNIVAWLKNARNLALVLAIVIFGATASFISLHSQGSRSTVSTLTKIPEARLMAAPQPSVSSSTVAITSTPAATSTPPKTPPALSTSATPISTSTIAARQLTNSGLQLLKSMVNIVCLSGDPSVPSISATGVIIDPRGVILTAAHVGQFFLLQDYLGPTKVQCLIRAGSPARRAYVADAIYVSPSWIQANPATLAESSPRGTGQDDFALLAITGTATSTPLPSSFPYMPLSASDPTAGEPVAIGSYGAQYLSSTELNYSLYPILVFGKLQTRYTYGTNTVDLISVEGSAASQEGSSGGAMTNAAGQLIGTITTSSITGDISTRSLNALTTNYMRRSYLKDTGNNLDGILANSSLPQLIANFKGEGQKLGALLSQNL